MEIRLRAWVGRRYVDLADVLRMVGDNAWVWRLEEFEGSTGTGSALSAGEVAERLRAEESITFGWAELVSFADGLHQTIWCSLIAVDPDRWAPVITIDCVDSSSWELAAPEGDSGGVEVLRRMARLWPTAG